MMTKKNNKLINALFFGVTSQHIGGAVIEFSKILFILYGRAHIVRLLLPATRSSEPLSFDFLWNVV